MSVTEAFEFASLPTPGTPGRQVRVLDRNRGVWMDTGLGWYPLDGGEFHVGEYGAKFDGRTVSGLAYVTATTCRAEYLDQYADGGKWGWINGGDSPTSVTGALTTTAGSATVSLAGAAFVGGSTGDVGKWIMLPGAGANGATHYTTIAAVTSATVIEVSSAPLRSQSAVSQTVRYAGEVQVQLGAIRVDANGPLATLRSGVIVNPYLVGGRIALATDDQAAINECYAAVRAAGGGLVKLPPGWCVTTRSLDQRTMSNCGTEGHGMGATVVRCTDALDGSHNETNNHVFNAGNTTLALDRYYDSLWWAHFTIDAREQHAGGMPINQVVGMNLSGIEGQNAKRMRAYKVEFIGCWGNGFVAGTTAPRASMALQGVEVVDCVFRNTPNGGLPHYNDNSTGLPITGTALQYGSGVGGTIRADFIDCNGPATDTFNVSGLQVDTYHRGYGGRPPARGQTVNTVHSDFGVESSEFRVRSVDAGGVYMTGLMTPNFFNDQIGTPGPQDTTYDLGIEGTATAPYLGPPALPLSGGKVRNLTGVDAYVAISGGSGVALSIDGRAVAHASLGHVVVPAWAALVITYTSAPTWTWYLASGQAWGSEPAMVTTGNSATNSSGAPIIVRVRPTVSGTPRNDLALPPDPGYVQASISSTRLSGQGVRRNLFSVPDGAALKLTFASLASLSSQLDAYYPLLAPLTVDGLDWDWWTLIQWPSSIAAPATDTTFSNPLPVPIGVTVAVTGGSITRVRTTVSGSLAAVALTGEANDQFLVPAGGSADLTYTGTISTWTVVQAPNGLTPTFYTVGGSSADGLGSVRGIRVRGTIVRPPREAVQAYELVDADIDLSVTNVGDWVPADAYWLLDSGAYSGSGSKRVRIRGAVRDTRSTRTMRSIYRDNAGGNADIRLGPGLYVDPGTVSTLDLSAGGAASRVNATGNHGEGAVTGALTAPSLPGSGNTTTNPFSYDCVVYVSGGTSVAVSVDGTATNLASGMFRVRHGGTISLGAYSGTPVWVWIVA